METHNLKAGTTLQNGKYKIVRFISSGGFGCTYEAIDTLMDTRVAIKEFFVKDFCNRDAETQHITLATQNKRGLIDKLHHKFVDEAKAIFQMKHDNIVRVYGFFEENNTAYYVMEYIDGESLHDVLKRRGSLSESEALGYIRQVAEALKYVHSKNRLHLDIKPANIMVDAKGHAILIDFGASKQYDEVDGENTSTLLGKTPGYAPIEQMGNKVQTFSAATDIYALGATFYKLITGETPADATEIADDEDALKPISNNVSLEVRNTIMKSLEVRRKDRQQNIDEFLSLLSAKVEPAADEEDTISEDMCNVEEERRVAEEERTRIEGEAKDEEKRKLVEEAKTIMNLYPDGFNYYVKIGVLTNSPLELSDCQEIIYMKSAIVSKQNELRETEKKIRQEAREIMNSYPEGGNYYVRTKVLSGSLLELSDCQKIINMKSQIINKQNEFDQEQEQKRREEIARKAAEEKAAKKSNSWVLIILFLGLIIAIGVAIVLQNQKEENAVNNPINNYSESENVTVADNEVKQSLKKDNQKNYEVERIESFIKDYLFDSTNQSLLFEDWWIDSHSQGLLRSFLLKENPDYGDQRLGGCFLYGFEPGEDYTFKPLKVYHDDEYYYVDVIDDTYGVKRTIRYSAFIKDETIILTDCSWVYDSTSNPKNVLINFYEKL